MSAGETDAEWVTMGARQDDPGGPAEDEPRGSQSHRALTMAITVLHMGPLAILVLLVVV